MRAELFCKLYKHCRLNNTGNPGAAPARTGADCLGASKSVNYLLFRQAAQSSRVCRGCTPTIGSSTLAPELIHKVINQVRPSRVVAGIKLLHITFCLDNLSEI